MVSEIFLEEFTSKIADTSGIKKRPQMTFSLHYHPAIEVVYCKSGILVLQGEKEKDIVLHAGEAALLPPLLIHGYHSQDAVECGVIVFDDKMFLDVENMDLFCMAQQAFHCTDLMVEQQRHIEELMHRIAQFQQKQDTSLLHLYSKILLTLMVRMAVCEMNSIGTMKPETNYLLNDILLYIRLHFKEREVALSDIAAAVNTNKFTVSRLIHQNLKMTLHQLLNQYRFQEACWLLTQTNQSVLHISEEVGFRSVSSFNRNFRQQFLMTPSDYRKQSRYPFS